MANKKLPKFTLEFDEKKSKWSLEKDKTGEVLRTFATKEKATQGGVLKKALGDDGGSVKIQRKDGKYEEERTYPQTADPSQSKG